MMLSVGLSYVLCMDAHGRRARRRGGGGGGGGGEYFLVPRKFNEMVESISTTLTDNDIGEYF